MIFGRQYPPESVKTVVLQGYNYKYIEEGDVFLLQGPDNLWQKVRRDEFLKLQGAPLSSQSLGTNKMSSYSQLKSDYDSEQHMMMRNSHPKIMESIENRYIIGGD